MSKLSQIFEYMRGCPQLKNLWSIGATEDIGVRVILPQGASQKFKYEEAKDVNGNYECDIIPFPSYYEDYQINCFQAFDAKDSSRPKSNLNVLSYDEVESICDWIEAQNDKGKLPAITGRNVVSIECNPCVPQIRYVNQDENIIAYFITVRIRYVNNAKRKWVEF